MKLFFVITGCYAGLWLPWNVPNLFVHPRSNTIGHDDVKVIPENVAPDSLAKRFQPLLHIAHGCHPFPAFDLDNHLGGGLYPSGKVSGKCSSSPGQAYTRSQTFDNLTAIVFAYYFPKEQNRNTIVTAGHRHAWHHVVLFLDEGKPARLILDKFGDEHYSYITWSSIGDRPQIVKSYETLSLYLGDGSGDSQALVEWTLLPKTLISPLEDSIWESVDPYSSQKCPLLDANFPKVIEAAYWAK